MDRRVLAAFLAVAMSLTMAGCKASDKGGENSSPAEKSKETDSSTSSELHVDLDNLDDAPILPDSSSGYGSEGTVNGADYKEDETGKKVVQGSGVDGVFDTKLFTFEYDTDKWTLNTENDLIVTTAYFVNERSSATVSVVADSIDTAERTVPTLEESHEKIMSSLENMGCEDIKEQELTIGGEKALLTQAKNILEEDVALYLAYVECNHNDVHIVMQLVGTGDDYGDYEKSFIEMANSFKFTD